MLINDDRGRRRGFLTPAHQASDAKNHERVRPPATVYQAVFDMRLLKYVSTALDFPVFVGRTTKCAYNIILPI